MSPVFLDTVGLVALWVRADRWHSAASVGIDGTINRAHRPSSEHVMQSFEGIYENGVVRFLGPVALPEHAKVTVVAQASENPMLGCNSPELYEVLRHGYETGEHDLAARIDEIDP